MSRHYLFCKFPRLRNDSHFRIIDPDPSHPNEKYNCYAYALGKTNAFLSTLPLPGHEWPTQVNRRPDSPDHLESYVELFEFHGYRRCSEASEVQSADCALEKGVEKVALYVKKKVRKSANGANYLECAHIAKQLPSGRWSSKNERFDIFEHALESLESDDADDSATRPVIPSECKEPRPDGGFDVHLPINDWRLALIMSRCAVLGWPDAVG
jgi:hypothetical protein